MTPEERIAEARETSQTTALGLGGLVGSAKWAVKTGWGMLKFALGMGGHEELGETVIEAAQDPKKATQAYVEGKRREYNESLDRAQQHLLRGDHFAAGADFAEEFAAPTAAEGVTIVEGVGAFGRATVRRTSWVR